MARIDSLVRDFLQQKTIAIVGVSDRRETGSNLSYRKFKAGGYAVYAINPRITAFEGDPCYPDLRALPHKPDGVFVFANPQVTKKIVQQCVDLGIPRVWMHCGLGTKPGLAAGMTSVSQEAVEMCRQHGITVIPGACPNQFLNPDVAHAAMRVLWRAFGFLRVD